MSQRTAWDNLGMLWAVLEEPRLDILGCRQTWLLRERRGELAGRRGKHALQRIVSPPGQCSCH